MRRSILAVMAFLLVGLVPVPAQAAPSWQLRLARISDVPAGGGTATLTGALLDSEGTRVTGAAGTIVTIWAARSSHIPHWTVPVDEAGRFTTQVKVKTTTLFIAKTTYQGQKPSSVTREAFVVGGPLPMSLNARLSGKGMLHTTVRYRAFSPHRIQQDLYLDELRNGTWHQVMRISKTYQSVRFTHPGTIRLRYDGDAFYARTVTPGLKVWRTESKISKIQVTPRHVRVGAPITVSGTLYGRRKPGGSYTPLPAQSVRISFTCDGRTYYWSAVKTNAHGRFRKTLKTYCDASYVVQFMGGSRYFSSRSNSVVVDTEGKPQPVPVK